MAGGAGAPGWALPHHDGSATYVAEAEPSLGDDVPVFLRVPRASGVRTALLRVVVDGEQELRPTVVDREDQTEVWLRAEVPMHNPVVNYRWLLDGVPHGYQWLDGEGVHAHDVTDAADFRLSTHQAPPSWAADAVLYQIFPDRFAKSVDRPTPDWAVPQAWDDPVVGRGPQTPYQYYGGDLDGIVAHLDHIAATGADTVYLTPIFPARSNHRYDASTFDHVDPLLGGDAALARLSDALHARGMRLLGDLTTNHVGDAHEWFRSAVADAGSPEAGYFTFHRHPDEYVCYAGFTRPMWQWLRPPTDVSFEPGPFTPFPSFPGPGVAAAMRAFAAAQPWRATAHALTLVGSHDTVRIRTLLGDEGLVTVAFGLLATMPGIPMLWAGDEIGQEGVNGEDGRRPFPWHRTEDWDRNRFATNQALFAARREHIALRRGGMRWLAVQDDSLTFLREAPGETVLVHAARAGHPPVRIPAGVLGRRLAGLAGSPNLVPTASGEVVLPSDGPAVGIWICER